MPSESTESASARISTQLALGRPEDAHGPRWCLAVVLPSMGPAVFRAGFRCRRGGAGFSQGFGLGRAISTNSSNGHSSYHFKETSCCPHSRRRAASLRDEVTRDMMSLVVMDGEDWEEGPLPASGPLSRTRRGGRWWPLMLVDSWHRGHCGVADGRRGCLAGRTRGASHGNIVSRSDGHQSQSAQGGMQVLDDGTGNISQSQVGARVNSHCRLAEVQYTLQMRLH
jgi:hypothetical protein